MKKLVSYEKLNLVARKHASNGFTLAIAILLTIEALLSVAQIITGDGNAIGQIVLLVFYVLSSIGLWQLYASAKKQDGKFLSHLKLAKSLPSFLHVITIIITVIVGLFGLIIVAFVSVFDEVYDKILDGMPSDVSSQPEVIDALDMIEKFIDLGTGLIVLLVVLAMVVLVFNCIMHGSLNRTLKSLYRAEEYKSEFKNRLTFTAVLLFIFGTIELLNIASSFGNAFAIASKLVEFTYTLFVGIEFIRLEKDLSVQ